MLDAAPLLELEAYRSASQRWFEWLDGDPEHSITAQLSSLLWHDAVFRSLNEARRLASKEKPTAAVSPYLAQFLDRGYVDGQVLGISKLVEKHHGDPNKGVISLRRLVDDLREHRNLLTRANYLGRDGYPYDFAPVMQADLAEHMKAASDQAAFFRGHTEGPKAWATAERMHAQFDRLADVADDAREPTDRVSDAMLDRLLAVFDDDVFTVVRDIRHKVIAHAADATSRAKVAGGRRGIKFDEADRAHQLLIGLAQLISATVLHGPWRGAAIPVPQQNPFEHLDQPFVPEGGIDRLQGFWHEESARKDNWLNSSWEDFLK